MNKPSFWSKFTKKQHSKSNGNHELAKTSKTTTDLSTTSLRTPNSKYAEAMESKTLKHYPPNKKHGKNASKYDAKTDIDIKYVENMVCQVKELKKRLQHFEMCHIQQNICTEPTQIGDFEIQNLDKPTEHDLMNRLIKSVGPIPNRLDRRSIYTNSRPQSNSKNEKNKSNTTIVMSMGTTNKPELVKIRESRNDFHTVAEEFIQQAEELKGQIGYILNCTGYAIASSSERSMRSNISASTIASSAQSGCNETVKSLANTLRGQYKEILSILLEVDKRLNDLAKPVKKPQKKVSKTCSRSSSSSKSSKKKSKSKKSPKVSSKSSDMKVSSGASSNKNLEPVVMVYEPIQPNANQQKCKVCKYCGREYGPCVDACNGPGPDVKNSYSTVKSSSKDQKIGFVVTYTPDFGSQPVNIYEDSKKKPKKKKTLSVVLVILVFTINMYIFHISL